MTVRALIVSFALGIITLAPSSTHAEDQKWCPKTVVVVDGEAYNRENVGARGVDNVISAVGVVFPDAQKYEQVATGIAELDRAGATARVDGFARALPVGAETIVVVHYSAFTTVQQFEDDARFRVFINALEETHSADKLRYVVYTRSVQQNASSWEGMIAKFVPEVEDLRSRVKVIDNRAGKASRFGLDRDATARKELLTHLRLLKAGCDPAAHDAATVIPPA